MIHKVVARFSDGRLKRGTTEDFAPNRDFFTLSVENESNPAGKMKILLEDLKAVFFVQTLDGSRDYHEQKLQDPERKIGKRLLVTFNDGETMRGTTMGTNLNPIGFLLFPADPRSNNKRIFVIRASVRSIQEEK